MASRLRRLPGVPEQDKPGDSSLRDIEGFFDTMIKNRQDLTTPVDLSKSTPKLTLKTTSRLLLGGEATTKQGLARSSRLNKPALNQKPSTLEELQAKREQRASQLVKRTVVSETRLKKKIAFYRQEIKSLLANAKHYVQDL
jgi:hypothetical protein